MTRNGDKGGKKGSVFWGCRFFNRGGQSNCDSPSARVRKGGRGREEGRKRDL